MPFGILLWYWREMKYILNKKIALRSWEQVPYAYYIKNQPYAKGLTKAEFEVLRKCDGIQEVEENECLKNLLQRRLIHVCREGETLSEWQEYRSCDNRYFPKMNWMITGKCNYNCLHCFNAADNAPMMSEWTIDEAERMLEEARKCGIHAFTITGGEPLLHRNFREIVKMIYERGMFIEELNTNGHFIHQELLDFFKETECSPLIKISFDCIGWHDWLRNKSGAEADAVRAIRLCTENGFRVKAQTNVHRKNLPSLLETAELLESLGVCEMRIIRTTEAPRWEENAPGMSLTLEEYMESMLSFVGEYMKKPHRMAIDIWQLMTLFPKEKRYTVRAVSYADGEYRDTLPVCKGNRGMIAVAANGTVVPCHQMSGYYEKFGYHLGNVKKDSLQMILKEGEYLTAVCTTVKDLYDNNEKCRTCKYFKHCCGGCRALGLLFTGDKLGSDLSKCLLFEKGYYERLTQLMKDWENRRRMTL